MTAEIISVGTELLMGQIVNTDAQYLAKFLSELGINLYHQETVGDNMTRLKDCISLALIRSDIVILSGGLGPTADDLTKLAVAEVMGVDMVRDEESVKTLESFFKGINREITPNNYRQAEFPRGSHILPNGRGTAPGCICEFAGKIIIVLPGPPHELMAMTELSVRPFLEKMCDCKIKSRVIRVFGIGESAVEHMLKDMIEEQTNPTIAPYAALAEVSLRVTARCALDEDPDALLDPVVGAIVDRLGPAAYSTEDEPLPNAAARVLKEKGLTVSIAESITGGMIASELVSVPGISKHLLEGVVVYTDAAKLRLGVSEDTLNKFSSVSEQAAMEMAKAMRERAGADIAISSTGVAGPDPDDRGNPVGLVYIGVSDKNGERTVRIQQGGNRERMRKVAELTALFELRKAAHAL